ncbi:uncharacterized protein LOC126175270 isoform X2 [Schistocerca cancellata]|uniref:uncharacterized protein LOC126175270 isoform X2 n=1 Tax=Schistocerca cancellata TaxID=274614 RepID=UPI00211901F3|nr:uncharacterized protein LOC126175270 isoform X2 [Schistocerca cancellata]
MNTLDMPMSYVPALDEQDAVGKDAGMETLPVDLMALIDDCSADWANDDSEDLLAALGGESFEQALEEGVTLLDGGCGLIEEDVMDFVAEEIAAAACADVETEAQPAETAAQPAETADGASSQPTTPRKHVDPLLNPAFLSPFSLCSIKYADKAACHPGENIWKKFEFPTEVPRDENQLVDLKEYAKKFQKGIPHIDWDAELAYYEPAAEKSSKRKGVKEERDIMWSLPQCDLAYRPLPMLTPAQLRRKLMEEDTRRRPCGADAAVAVTPDNSLLLANRSTTVPAASAMKSRPMRSLLNTKQQQQHVVKTSSRSLLLPTARTKVQAAAGAAATHAVVKQKAPATTTCDPVPPAETSVEIKASRFTGPEGEPLTSSRPETPQSITESEDEAPVFRHNTIDTIFTSSMCDPSSSTVYLTPSDSSGSPKSTIGDEDDDDDEDEEEEEEEEEEDYEHQNLRSPPESVIREERPARTVLPYISDHSYHLSKSNVRIDGLGVQTPSDSEEEIDVVSVGGDKGTARLPNNPSARDRRQIQMKVATAIHRQSRHDAADSPPASRKRQAVPTTGRSSSSVKRARNATAPLVLGRGKGKGKAFGAGRGRRRANADEEPDPCEKRSMHNSMERQRRIDLRNLVERLRTVVPATENNKRAAKVVILREAAKFCDEMTATVDSQEAELRALRSKQTGLQRKLSSLRTELAVIRMRDEQGSCFGNDYFTVEEIKPEPVEVDEDYREYCGF